MSRLLELLNNNPMQDIKQQLLEEFSEYETNFGKGVLYTIGKGKYTILDYVEKLLSLAVEQEKDRVLAMVLKEIEESKEECTECANREKHDTPINNALDTLKERLQAKQ